MHWAFWQDTLPTLYFSINNKILTKFDSKLEVYLGKLLIFSKQLLPSSDRQKWDDVLKVIPNPNHYRTLVQSTHTALMKLVNEILIHNFKMKVVIKFDFYISPLFQLTDSVRKIRCPNDKVPIRVSLLSIQIHCII